MVLITAPVSRPCEPPAGLAKLSGILKDHGVEHLVIDANLECLLHLITSGEPLHAQDTWTRRSARHVEKNLRSLRDGTAFGNMGAYIKAVTELNRILEVRSKSHGVHVSLNNFTHMRRSPVKSADLLHAAEHPEDNVFYPYFLKRLQALLEEHAPGYLGFSLNYLSQVLTTFAMIGQAKILSPGTKILLGGGLVTSWMRGPMKTNTFAGLVDEIVDGPGEDRLLSLFRGETPSRISLPEYGGFQTRDYLSPGSIIPLSTSTGCYWGRCSFCPEKSENTRYCPVPGGAVVSLVRHVLKKHSPALVHFCDNALSPSIIASLAREELPSPWYGFAKIIPELADPDLCSSLKRSGCVMLQLGLESGDQGVLDKLGKGIRLETAAHVLKSLTRAGIATYVYILFGTPEDCVGAQKTLDFVSRHQEAIDFLNVSIFNLPRYSHDAANLTTFDFSEGDLSLYQGFVHPAGWDRNRVRQFLDKEFKRQRSIARIVRQDPPFFTSNHAPLFAKR
ncbi:MAG TPA: radical SAM protein [Deltaproteobacteria bacterium]|nr:radical SAM protein [Deltaproteobacteria bacterium]